MARISHLIPSMYNGISQQVPSLRLPSQMESVVNSYPSLVEGLIKRPPLKVIKKLNSTALTDYHAHFINRDEDERYVVLVRPPDGSWGIKVFDLAGTEKTVNTTALSTQLNCTYPRRSLQCLTVADHTFILNKEMKVLMDDTETPETAPYLALVWIKKGVPEVKYTVTVDGTEKSVTTTTTGSSYMTDTIAGGLKTALEAITGLTVEQRGSVLKITKASDFTFRVHDSWGEQAMAGIKDAVQKYTELPPRCWDGVRVKVTGNVEEGSDDYYVKFVSSSDYGSGVWKEARGWNQENILDGATMPHKLVRQEDGSFKFEAITWSDRLVGDDNTAPVPSFVDDYIKDIFFYRNRLGFICGENIVLSRAGDYFTLFPKTVTQALDDDPIDIAVSHVKVSLIQHAVPFAQNLLLCSNQTQFQMSSDTMLTPTDVRIDQATEFEMNTAVKPVGAGANVYFVVPRGNHSGVKEYFVAEDGVTKDASDITAHVPNFLPKDLYKIACANNSEVLFFLSDATGHKHKIYVYKYYWQGDEKVQSAWSVWELPSDAVIMGGDCINTTLYLVINRGDGIFLVSFDIESGLADGNLGFQVLLDYRTERTGVYDPVNNHTTWTIPYEYAGTDLKVVLGSAFGGRSGSLLYGTTRPANTTVRATGDWSAGVCYIGLGYTQEVEFSEIFVKEDKEETRAIIGGRLQLLEMVVHYQDTYMFDVEVKPLYRDSSVYQMKPRLGTEGRTLGTPVMSSGAFKFPVLSKSNQVRIILKNATHFPSAFHSAEWTGHHVILSERR